MSDNIEMLARIDERTAQILNRQDDIFERLDRLDKTVYTGNGTPSLVQRMALMEQQFANFMLVCTDCRKIIYAPKPPEKKEESEKTAAAAVALAALDEKKTITVERWKFYTAVATGVIAVLVALVALIK
jgi:hypothetical protein